MSKTHEVLSTETKSFRDEDLVGKAIETGACACGLYRYAAEVDGDKQGHHYTNCYSTTGRTFAPGHDARLKGFLIEAGAALVTRIERKRAVANGDVTETWATVKSLKTERVKTILVERRYGFDWHWDSFTTAQAVADGYGFHHQVANGIRAALAKQAKKDIKQGRKPAKVEAVADAAPTKEEAVGDTQAETVHTDKQGQVKAGRWWYDQSTGERGENGGLLYIAKDGSIKEAKPDAETR